MSAKKQDVRERLDKARTLHQRNLKAQEQHQARAMRFRVKGQQEKADKADALAERAARLAAKWEREVQRLEMPAARAASTERRIANLRMITTAEHRAIIKELTPKQRREQEKRAKLERIGAETKQKRLAAAGMDYYDPRTAQGHREFDVVSLGPTLRVSVNHFNNCFKRKGDRTDARILAWSKFDEHCHKVHAGLIANPRYEPGVDVSTRPGVSDSRLDAVAADAHWETRLGRDMHGLLVNIIYFQKSYRDLAGEGHGDEKLIAGMFKRALDLLAFHLGYGDDQSFGRDLNRTLKTEAEAPRAV